MKLHFSKLEIQNFLSMGNASINLDTDGFTQVVGVNKNENDRAESNGSGKSTILEALVWALTGETLRGVRRVKNAYTDEGAFVSVNFVHDNDKFVVSRSQDHSIYKTNLVIIKNDTDISGKGIRDSEKILEKELPELTTSLIGSVIILGQGLPNRFTSNTPSGRKEVLEKLTNSDFMIEDLNTRVSVRKSTLTEQLNGLTQKKIEMSSIIRALQDSIDSDERQLASLKDVSIIREEVDKKTQCVKEIENKVENNTEILKSLRSKIDGIYSQILSSTSDIETAKRLIEEECDGDISDLTKSIYKLQAEESQLKSEISKIKSIREVCPTCGQKLVGVVKPDTSPLSSRLSEIETEISEQSTRLSEYKAQKNKRLTESVSSTKEKVNSLKAQKTEIERNVCMLEGENATLKRRADTLTTEIKSLMREIESHDLTQKLLTERIGGNKKQIEEIETAILYNKSEEEIALEHLSVLNQMQTMLKRDFRGFLLSNIITSISKCAKVYCQDIFGNDLVDIVLEGNNLMVYFKEKQYECLSGGEKQKIDIILQLSLREVLCKYLNFTCNIICFDEIFDNCDRIGCSGILNVITNRLSDVSGIYIITHHAELGIPYDNQIKVIKDNDNISYIER